jgi:hypothetical protein
MVAGSERPRMVLTKRRTPIPEKTTFTGENTWGMAIRSIILGRQRIKTDETNTLTKSGGERVKNVHGMIEPIC